MKIEKSIDVKNMNVNKVIDISAMLVAAEVQNGNRIHYFYDWDDLKLDKIAKTAVKLAKAIIKNAEK